jgi:hypothetical protein
MFDPEYDRIVAEWRHKNHVHRARVARDIGNGSSVRARLAEGLREAARRLDPPQTFDGNEVTA